MERYERELSEVTLESLMNELDRTQLQIQMEVLLALCEENHLLSDSIVFQENVSLKRELNQLLACGE